MFLKIDITESLSFFLIDYKRCKLLFGVTVWMHISRDRYQSGTAKVSALGVRMHVITGVQFAMAAASSEKQGRARRIIEAA